MLTRRSGTTSAPASRQNLSYTWDASANLTQRTDVNQNVSEAFWYDELNRLDYSRRNGALNLDLTVDQIGNIMYKSDVGTYAYSTRPHAVSSVTNSPSGVTSFTYDDNGNMVTRAGSPISWTSYNLPSVINAGGLTSSIEYSPDRRRYKQVATYASGTETTYYIGGLMEKMVLSGGATAYRHYVHAGSTIILHTRWMDGPIQTFYVSKDHLGSTNVITNASGASMIDESFDAFGKRRGADWSGNPTATELQTIANITRRGYTEHEHLSNVGLIHMNGRVQDPSLGRFISADPYVLAPDDTQSFNRYSYVRNNPLNSIDPSGFAQNCYTEQWTGGGYAGMQSIQVEDGNGNIIEVPIETTVSVAQSMVVCIDFMEPNIAVGMPSFDVGIANESTMTSDTQGAQLLKADICKQYSDSLFETQSYGQLDVAGDTADIAELMANANAARAAKDAAARSWLGLMGPAVLQQGGFHPVLGAVQASAWAFNESRALALISRGSAAGAGFVGIGADTSSAFNNFTSNDPLRGTLDTISVVTTGSMMLAPGTVLIMGPIWVSAKTYIPTTRAAERASCEMGGVAILGVSGLF